MSRCSVLQISLFLLAVLLFSACQKNQQKATLDAQSLQSDAVEIFLRISAGYSTPQGQYISRSPVFVLYRSGRVVFNQQGKYREAQLTTDEKAELLARLAELNLRKITPEKLREEEATLDHPVFLSDAGSAILGYRQGEQFRIVQANGLTVKARNYKNLPAWQNFARINDLLANFKHKSARPYRGPVAVCFLKAPSKIMAAGAPVLNWPLEAIIPVVMETLPVSADQEIVVGQPDLAEKLLEMNGKIYQKDEQYFTVYTRVSPPGAEQTRQWGRL